MSDERPPEFGVALATFQSFLNRVNPANPITILCHSDADGVAAGAILYRALQRLDFANLTILVTGKGANAYTPQTREQVAATKPTTLFVLDLGCLQEPVLPGVPTCFIDHHRPLGVPPEGVLISSYTWRPIPNSSLLVYWLCSEIAPCEDLLWIAAMGTLSDLGDKAPFSVIAQAKKLYKAKWLHEATALVNAGRRSSSGDAETALRAILAAQHPREIVEGASPEARKLAEYRAEVTAALEEGKKAAPKFSGQVALVRVHSPCQIHPLIAQIWRTRLPKYIVLVGNEGYLPGYVAFSMRTATDVNLLDLLSGVEVDVAEGYFGYGHDQATGGVLPTASWNQLLQHLGFPRETWAETGASH
ncbi:MAG: DHH family phosphoesterase [Anaerolineae bacterium]